MCQGIIAHSKLHTSTGGRLINIWNVNRGSGDLINNVCVFVDSHLTNDALLAEYNGWNIVYHLYFTVGGKYNILYWVGNHHTKWDIVCTHHGHNFVIFTDHSLTIQLNQNIIKQYLILRSGKH